MRILHIAPGCSFTESYKYQENLLTEYQSKLGYDVTLLTTTLKRDERGKMIDIGYEDRVLKNGVRLVRCFKLNKFNRITGYFPCTIEYIKRYNPDMIFVHGLCIFAMHYAVMYKKEHPSTVIVADNHQDEFNNQGNKLFSLVERIRFSTHWKTWINYVDKVYGTTSWRVTYAHQHYKIPLDKLDELLMGVDDDNMKGDYSIIRSETRKTLGIPEKAFVFVSGGKLNKHKMMIESLKEFITTKGNYYFILFGAISDDIASEMNELINRDPRIIYLGFIDGRSIYKYFYASDFGLFPGGHSVLWEEAIGCGVPCLFRKYEEKDHTDVCGNCIRISSPKQKDIGEVICKVTLSPEFYNQIKKNANNAKKSFSYYSIAEKSVECCVEDKDS